MSHIKNTCHVIDWENTDIMYGEQNELMQEFWEVVEIKRCKYRILNKIEEITSILDIWENLIL